MKFAAEFANWVKQSDGGFVWITGDCVLARVHSVNGLWRSTWYGRGKRNETYLSQQFQTAHDACLASEKSWPPSGEPCGLWLQSKNGGYFRQFGKRRVYLRQGVSSWYAVQTDGKVLGKKSGEISWFKSVLDAALAVQAERHTPVTQTHSGTTPTIGAGFELRTQRALLENANNPGRATPRG